MSVGATFTVDIQYSGNPRPLRGPWGELGWEELTDGALVAGQPNGAASWFPCNDHPSNKATYRITVTTDSPYRVVANGRLLDHTVRGSNTTWVYDQPEPMATYLASVQIGQYELLNVAEKPVRQQAALPERHRQEFADSVRPPAGDDVSLREAVRSISFSAIHDRRHRRRPRDPARGAEHVDLRRRTILDDDGDERLIAHELAHQWFGNSLTADAWEHIWLHEGFACYAEWLWSEESGGTSAARLAARHHERLADLPQDLVIADPGPQLMFDDRLYKRGALTLHAIRRTVGDKAFFALLRDWVAAHRHGSVNTALFVAHAEQYAEQSLRPLFTEWLLHKPLPALSAARR